MSAQPDRQTALRALRHRNFAVFWTAALFSNAAQWMQNVAVQFIMFDLTDSNTWVGAAGFAMLIPAVVVTPVAGVVADRVSRRAVISVTLAVQTGVATAFLVLWLGDSLTPWWIVVLNLVAGTAAGTQIANWQSFVPLLVPREDMLPAVRLNSTQFTAARALGPMVGAGLLSAVGAAAVFAGNAATFVVLVATVVLVRARSTPAARGQPIAEVFRYGVAYVRRRPALLMAMATGFAISFFGQSLLQIAAGLADDVYDVGSLGLAGFVTAAGVGAIAASMFIIARGDYVRRSSMALVGLALFGVGPIVTALTTWYPLGVLGYFLGGAAQVSVAISLNTSVQIQVDEDVRGRVLSIYLLGIFAGIPLGALVGGALGDVVGLRVVFAAYGIGLLAYLALAVARFGSLRILDLDHDTVGDPLRLG